MTNNVDFNQIFYPVSPYYSKSSYLTNYQKSNSDFSNVFMVSDIYTGTVTTSGSGITSGTNGNYKYYLFTSTSACTIVFNTSSSKRGNNIVINLLIVGGGGGGGTSSYASYSGGGGGGGTVNIYYNYIIQSSVTYTITCGSAGIYTLINGTDGGTSSFTSTSINLSSAGGKGGTFNKIGGTSPSGTATINNFQSTTTGGNGGNGINIGSSPFGSAYSSSYPTLDFPGYGNINISGGGGGGNAASNGGGGYGGNGTGGANGDNSASNNGDGQNGIAYGGGGGGGGLYFTTSHYGGNGNQGVILLSYRFQ